MITLYLVLCILKSSSQLQTDFSRNVIVSTKRCQVQMALSCPTTIPVEFSTLQISSGTTIPYYRSIKRSKLPACKTKPPFDRASGLLLMVAIKTRGGVFLQGPDRQTSDCPHPACWVPGSTFSCRLRTACPLLTDTAWEVHGNKVQVCTEVSSASLHIWAVCGMLSKMCNFSPEGGNTGRGVKCCLLMRTLDECLTNFSRRKYTSYSCSLYIFLYPTRFFWERESLEKHPDEYEAQKLPLTASLANFLRWVCNFIQQLDPPHQIRWRRDQCIRKRGDIINTCARSTNSTAFNPYR